MLLFLLGSVAMAILVKANENLTIKETFAVMIGMRHSMQNAKIDILHAATIIVPMGLWVHLIQGCADVST